MTAKAAVGGPKCAEQRIGDGAQACVTGHVPVAVVDRLDPVDIDEQHAGLDYAAAVGADVINMSFNAVLPKAGFWLPDGCLTEEQIDALATITRRAIRYARDSGATPIAAAGNNGLELDPDGPLVSFPAMTQGVIAVGALGPTGWALDPASDAPGPEPREL